MQNGHSEERCDVAIVGYGPVGQLLATLLGRGGHSVTVFERWPNLYPLPRAVHYDHEIARIFQGIGVADELSEVTEEATVYEWQTAGGEMLLALDFGGIGPSGWPTGTMFSQPQLEAVLDRAAKRTPGVSVHQGCAVTGLAVGADGVVVSARGEGGERRVMAEYVIGCDGANSFVRDAMGVEVRDLGFVFDWLIADVIPHDPSLLQGVNRQICDPERPTTMVSGGVGRRRWEWMLLDGETHEAAQQPDFIWGLLARSGVTPDDVELERAAVYTFRARWAEQWRQGRMLLAGDAAHQMPPFAGQGMCSGMRDALNLAWRLDLVLTGRAPETLLDTYTVERREQLQNAIAISVELGKVICISDPEAAAARDEGMLAAAAAMEEALPVPPSPNLGPGVITDSAGAGTLFPQGRVSVAGAEGLADDVIGRGFTLFVRDADPAASLSDSDRSYLESLGGQLVGVTPELDIDGTYGRWFAGLGVEAVLVRPDFYVFGTAASPADAGTLVGALRSALGTVTVG